MWKRKVALARGTLHSFSPSFSPKRGKERERGGGISGYTFSSHCAALKGVQWPWSESRIVSTARRNRVLRLWLLASSRSHSLALRRSPSYALPRSFSRLRVNERGVPFWCYSWAVDGASAPGPLNPQKSPEIPRNPPRHIMDRNNFKAPH